MTTSPIAIAARRAPAAPGGGALEFSELQETLSGEVAPIDSTLVQRLNDVCALVTTDDDELLAASRDWWPLGMVWAKTGRVARRAQVVVRPKTVEEISEIVKLCAEYMTPVIAAGGRSGVLGNSLPIHGGVVLDTTELSGITDLRIDDLTVDVLAGTFGDDFEEALQKVGYTAGHWPQSLALSTVGGWIACRGAGQMSTRYGTIADIVQSVTVVMADGSIVETSEYSHSSTGPDLTQLFVGSEGTLGIIVSARLRVWPLTGYFRQSAFAYESFDEGVQSIKRFMQRGAAPAIVRLYDEVESRRNFGTEGKHVLIVRDEGDATLVDANWQVVLDECDGEPMGSEPVETWLAKRNNVTVLEEIITDRAPDTMEITAPWSRITEIYHETTKAMLLVPGTRTATAHISHAYPDGVGLYFMFGGRTAVEDRPRWYREVWDTAATRVMRLGGNLAHHHGVGLGRARFMREGLGNGLDVLSAVKSALDPLDILNPGKLGLESRFGAIPSWKDTAPLP